MSKMKKRRLSWVASNSSQVISYKLYWTEEGGVDYTSQSADLGNITSVVLPDDVADFSPGNGPVEFGITAIDELGNESDMVTLFAPYQFSVPEAPTDLVMEALDDFNASDSLESDTETVEQPEAIELDDPPRLFKTV
jgi:hypothetical protein